MNSKAREILSYPQTDRASGDDLLAPRKRKVEKAVWAPNEGNNGFTTTDAPIDRKFGGSASIKVVVADSFPLMLCGISAVLEAEKDIQVVAKATNGNDALKFIKESKPDVAVVDLQLSGKDGLEVISALQYAKSKTRPVLLASQITQEQFLKAMQSGMRGLVLKTMPPPLLVRCVRLVYAGQEFLEKVAFLKAFEKLLRHSNAKDDFSRVLTRREFGVMELAVKGFSNKQVARELGISEGTVKVHLHQIYDKLRLQGRMRLLQYSQKAGLI